MTYALIKNGVVVNTIIADEEFIKTLSPIEYEAVICINDIYCSIGFLYDGKNFTAPVQPS